MLMTCLEQDWFRAFVSMPVSRGDFPVRFLQWAFFLLAILSRLSMRTRIVEISPFSGP